MATVRSWIIGTTAPAGSGKSYRRCAHFLATEWLPDREGVHYSNFPIHREVLAQAVADKTGKDFSALLNRIQVFPESVLSEWRAMESGPWDFFGGERCGVCGGKKGMECKSFDESGKLKETRLVPCDACKGSGWRREPTDLSGARIAIDEFHKYCSSQSPAKWRRKWGEWFGEIRHRNASVEIISQNPRKCAREVWDEAGTRLVLNNSENRRDPFFGVPLSDWYELRAGLITGKYIARVWEIEKREVDGKWKTEDARTFTLDPYYFAFYDSYNRPDESSVKAEQELHEFQKRGKLSLFFWFYRRNFFRLSTRLLVPVVVVYLMLGGGGQIFGLWQSWFLRIGHLQGVASAHGVGHGGGQVEVDKAAIMARAGGSSSRPATRPVDDPVQKELDATRVELGKLQDKFRSLGEVVLISPERATFRDGSSYAVGQTIWFGPFKGRRVGSISFVNLQVVLDDGSVLRLGRGL